MRRSITRTLSFFSKWLAEVLREPTLMLSLVLGPFLILLLFGAGTKIGGAPKPRTIVVSAPAPAGGDLLELVPEDVSQYLEIKEVTTDAQHAIDELAQGRVDLVAVLPPDPERALSEGTRAKVQIFTSEVDPLRDSYAKAYLYYQIGTLNQGTIEKAIAKAQISAGDVQGFVSKARGYVQLMRAAQGDVTQARQHLRDLKAAVDPVADTLTDTVGVMEGLVTLLMPGLSGQLEQARTLERSVRELQRDIERLDARLATATGGSGGPTPAELDQIQGRLTEIEATATQFKTIKPEVLSAPFELELKSVAPFEPSAIGFYAPAVLTLLLQHLAVTLGALSMTRIRLLGLMELLQTSPVRPGEVVVGNYLSYGSLCVVAGGVLIALLVGLLKVPIFGSLTVFASTVLLLVFCSLGIGFFISMIAASEQQAAQIAMLVLIASVFFSGFMIFLDAIEWPIRAVSYALPATYAIQTLRDVMLRGVLRNPNDLAILGVAGGIFFMLTIYLFHREFRPR